MNKLVSSRDVRKYFHDEQTIMYGGFMGVGTPGGLVRELLDSGAGDLTIIGTDTGFPGIGVGPLIEQRRVKRVITSHIGTNPETGRQMLAGEVEVELVPQGTVAERIRCGGSGLGGVLTPTGVGTVVEEGKTKLALDGVEFLVERPLRAEIGLIKAKRADHSGNLVYERAARNFNPLVAMACELVIVEVDELVDVGEMDPEVIVTPGVMVDIIIVAGGE